MVLRYDASELGKPEAMSNGWLKVDAFISRTGVQEYEKDGKPYFEYRPPDEVFRVDTISSFSAVPVTNNHPPGGLDAHNTKHYQVGTVDSPKRDGQRTRAKLLLTDASAIEAIKAGRSQLSCGYMCDLDETPGTTPDGQRYDALQRNIVGNHVALVDAARGGPELRLRLDASGVMVDAPTDVTVGSPEKGKGTPFMNPDEAKKLMESAAADKARADALSAEKATLEAQVKTHAARADAAEAKIAALDAELKALPAKLAEQAKARTALETAARKVTDAKFDGLSDREVKMLAINATLPSPIDASKSDAYVDAAFDIATANATPRVDATAPMPTQTTAPVDVIAEAHAKFLKRINGGK